MTDPFSPIIPWLVWIVPLIGAMLIPLIAKIGNNLRNISAVLFSFISALLAGLMLVGVFSGETVHSQVMWIPTLNITAGVLADPLRIIVSNVVAWISLLIMIYSIGYMKGDRNLTRYWFFMIFFIANMQIIILSDNFLQLFFGWEGVGLASYALIGFWNSDEKKDFVGSLNHKIRGLKQYYSPTHAGTKAFVTTKIGDVSFLIGILLLFYYAGTFDFVSLSSNTNWATILIDKGMFIPIAILIFGGAIGKSAQFPLQEWLPDAMAGPTSVSALIHAATMVKAGVFLVAVIGPIFYNAAMVIEAIRPFFTIIAFIGVFTAFLAASQAVVAKEIKKVLAYSTVSQIGYMMLALGVAGLSLDFVAGYTAGLFHLINHAIFKAALFMGAGALIHSVGSKYMSDMGNLKNKMKITFYMMLIATLSLSGIPPLSGFWSKDAIIASTLMIENALISNSLFIIALITALLTAFYSFRMLGLVFYGDKSNHIKKMETSGHHPHEASKVMWLPYAILSILTVIIGIFGLAFEESLRHIISEYLHHNFSNIHISHEHHLNTYSLVVSVFFVAVGSTLGYLSYISRKIDYNLVQNNLVLSNLHKFLYNRWYLNFIQYFIFVSGIKYVSNKIYKFIEHGFIDNWSDTSAIGTILFSKFAGKFDKEVVDGVVNGTKSEGEKSSMRLRKIQTGMTSDYVFGFALGGILLILFMIFML